MDKRIAKAYVEKAEENGILQVAIASDGVVDRHGESINQEGWNFKNFKKNPVFLWSHNSGVGEARPPIGKVKKLWFEGKGKRSKLMFQPQFDMEDDFARDIYRKYKDGFLSAFSVGFIPLEMEDNTYTKAELLEISAVPIPANPNATVQLSKSGMKTMSWKEVEDMDKARSFGEPVVKEVITDYETWKNSLDEDMVERFIEEIKSEAKEETIEEFTSMVKEVREEIKQSKESKVKPNEVGLKEIADFMRILNQATAIGLKKVKNLNNLKGGEK